MVKCVVEFIHDGDYTFINYEDVSSLGLKVLDIVTINGIKAEVREIKTEINSAYIFTKTYMCTSSGVEQ